MVVVPKEEVSIEVMSEIAAEVAEVLEVEGKEAEEETEEE